MYSYGLAPNPRDTTHHVAQTLLRKACVLSPCVLPCVAPLVRFFASHLSFAPSLRTFAHSLPRTHVLARAPSLSRSRTRPPSHSLPRFARSRTQTGTLLHRPASDLRSLIFCPDPTHSSVAGISTEGSVFIFNAGDLAPCGSIHLVRNEVATCLAFLPLRRWLFVGCVDGLVRAYDMAESSGGAQRFNNPVATLSPPRIHGLDEAEGGAAEGGGLGRKIVSVSASASVGLVVAGYEDGAVHAFDVSDPGGVVWLRDFMSTDGDDSSSSSSSSAGADGGGGGLARRESKVAEPEVARHMIILPSMDTLLCLVSGKNALGPALNIPVEAGARAWGVTKMRLCHLKTGQVRCNGEGREGGRVGARE